MSDRLECCGRLPELAAGILGHGERCRDRCPECRQHVSTHRHATACSRYTMSPQENRRELWAALALIREEVEQHTHVPAGEHLADPTPTTEAKVLVEAIARIAAKQGPGGAVGHKET